jgi:hypothetical protein
MSNEKREDALERVNGDSKDAGLFSRREASNCGIT